MMVMAMIQFNSIQFNSLLFMCRVNSVTCFEKLASEVVFTQQQILKFPGNRFVEAHIRGSAQATERELLEIGIVFAVLL
jgi:hypothetical protein